MTRDSKVSREIVERFHNAFEKHRPEDLDDLIGEGCVLENTAPAPDGARYEGREACLAFWKGVASSANLVFKLGKSPRWATAGSSAGSLAGANAKGTGFEASISCASGTERSSRSGIREGG
ncbi:SnoaL-like protein [Rhizobium sullae]|uniref:SnoaL-like protein n=1 Tax=Rhizobium sullae TaxID=50338 RepID=A0A4R3PV93_RHISU|nr:SnoaL-like protein [Rhizobium sullae]